MCKGACALKPATGRGEVEESCRLAWGSLTGALQGALASSTTPGPRAEQA